MDTAEVLEAGKQSNELVNFDTNGNLIVAKHTEASSKLVARRAIEAHLERKKLQLDDYWDDLEKDI
ncbi:PA3496 family putative envelope integrity protein [Bermanella sp. R86510]|uniref:PA3496 family putative envelope integrity protein n=1 Tax=unclassified Bermanella TaxID=2627862 RepID=UPI0037C6C46E